MHATGNNKYKDKESSYLMYWYAKNLYGWEIVKNYLLTFLNGISNI